MYPKTKQGTAGAHASNAAQGKNHASDKMSFASDTAAQTGLSERTIGVDMLPLLQAKARQAVSGPGVYGAKPLTVNLRQVISGL